MYFPKKKISLPTYQNFLKPHFSSYKYTKNKKDYAFVNTLKHNLIMHYLYRIKSISMLIRKQTGNFIEVLISALPLLGILMI